jgi:endonuclease/exonuclease/phosphatase family metal-dependent hydrolase
VKLATWNCYQGTDRKVPYLLDQLAPDIAVVPESSRSPQLAAGSLLRPPVPHAWVGHDDRKGLGIFAPCADELEVLETYEVAGARYALAVRIHMSAGPVTVLGIWTHPFAVGGQRTPYMNALLALLAGHEELLAEGNVIVAGDINCSSQSSPSDFPKLLDTVRDRYGLRSAYHDVMGVSPGDEEHMTLWWRRNPDAGFHCDVVFLPETWTATSVHVGAYGNWGAPEVSCGSDHAPVLADLTSST